MTVALGWLETGMLCIALGTNKGRFSFLVQHGILFIWLTDHKLGDVVGDGLSVEASRYLAK